jgi:hypothetical protein
VDSAGHSGNWANYISAIENADQIVGELWSWLQQDPHYSGTTTLVVTNDHGRHTNNFSGHGDQCEGCRTIQFLAVGPGIKAGYVSNVPRTIPDIAPTIAVLLGFQTEFASGEIMTEILSYDCNGNGVPDDQDIAAGTSLDDNGNGIPDECEATCHCGDLDEDGGQVDLGDFNQFAVCYGLRGPTEQCPQERFDCADLNQDDWVNLTDFSTFQLLFGTVSSNSPPDCP